MPVQIAAILAHELVHAAVGIAAGHRKAFKRIASGLGLVGSVRATMPEDAFVAAAVPILDRVGPLPHARLDTGGQTTAPKKQSTKLLKWECEISGYMVRSARKWLELPDAPLCPTLGHGPMRQIRWTFRTKRMYGSGNTFTCKVFNMFTRKHVRELT